MKLIVLGPSQSGKTCLAVGLANTSYGKELFKRAFVATAKGTTSRDHLTELRLMLEGAEWPGGTKDSKAKTLDFEFQWKNDKVEFSFDDYDGENVTQKDFRVKLENLGEEDGVALLVNPGLSYSYVEEKVGSPRLASDAEIVNGKTDSGLPVLTASAFDDSPLARKWLVGQEKIYEQLIEDLSTKNGGNKSGKPIVALTVTASDRLNSDLSKIRPRFEAFLEKIKNRLDTGRFKWRPFEVSITGILEDQSKPKLAGGLSNTSAEPFLWLLGRLAWRIRFEVWKKRAMLGSVIAAGFALCVGIYAWVAAGKDAENLRRWEVSCNNHLGNARNNNNSEGVKAKEELGEAIKEYSKIRKHHGFYEEKAIEAADRLEADIWDVQKMLIAVRINVIDESQGKKGNNEDNNKVDDLFALFKPSVLSNALAVEYAKLQEEWEEKKPGFLEANSIWNLREKVQVPLAKSINEHGETIIATNLYLLYDAILSIESKSEKIYTVKMDLASNLDSRVEKEWRDFAIPDFGAAASTNATREATRDFVTLLDEWKPVTTNGTSAKMELMALVTNSVPKWRTKYEMTHFSDIKSEALKNRSLEDLAKLYPARVVTNEYLTLEYVTEQWTNGLKDAYDETYARYITNFVNTVAERRGCPTLVDDDIEKITREAGTVGIPFDKTNVIAEIQAAVEGRATEWRSQKRMECMGWISREVRPDRKGAELVREYIREKRNHWDPEDIFNETIRKEVYRHCEECFENDISYFKRNYNDQSKCEERFNDYFKPLCITIAEDTKDPDEVSWAIRFAKACIDTGHVKDGFEKAFQEEFEITSINGMIDYDGANPFEGFLGTQFGVDIWRRADSKPLTILERDKSKKVNNYLNNKKWHLVSKGEGRKVYTSFASPIHFGMSIHDDRNGEIDYRESYGKVPDFHRWLDPSYTNTSDEIWIDIGGPFGKQTEDRKLKAYVRVNMKRISGGGIGVLLSRAKESQKVER